MHKFGVLLVKLAQLMMFLASITSKIREFVNSWSNFN